MYRAQDANGKIHDYEVKPRIEWQAGAWFLGHDNSAFFVVEDGRPNSEWEKACFNLDEVTPEIIDGILCAPKKQEEYKTNRTHEEFEKHLKNSCCLAIGTKHSHYFKDVHHLDYVDVYRIIDLFNVTNPCDQHALKKILCSGERGHKDIVQDTQDVIDTMQRKLQMFEENIK